MSIEIKRNIKSGPFFELHSSKNDKKCLHWNENSIFIEDYIFNLLMSEFEKSKDGFNFFGPNCLAINQQILLRNYLIGLHGKLKNLKSKEDFVGFLREKKGGNEFLSEINYFADQLQWGGLQVSIMDLILEIVEFLENSIKKSMVLWVLGI